jgi:hypothetical protein
MLLFGQSQLVLAVNGSVLHSNAFASQVFAAVESLEVPRLCVSQRSPFSQHLFSAQRSLFLSSRIVILGPEVPFSVLALSLPTVLDHLWPFSTL